MSATSGSPTQLATSCDTPSDLAGTPDDAFKDGDLASVRSLWPNSTFRLRRTAPAIAPDNVTAISTYSGNGYWEVFGPSGAVLVFDTVAELAAFDDAAMPDGALVYVASVRSYWSKLVGANPGVVDNITNVRNPSNTATWLRDAPPSLSWQSQVSWYVDPVNGSDENTGATALLALKTWSEFARRIKTISTNLVVSILGNLAEPLVGTFAKGTADSSLVVQGVPTVLASGTASTFVDPVPATNTRGTVTVADLTTSGGAPTNFDAYVGKLLRSPATSSAGVFVAPVLASVAGVAQTGWWARASLSTTAPINGALVEVIEPPTCPFVQIVTDGVPVQANQIRFTDVTLNGTNFVTRGTELGLVPTNLSGAFFGCVISGYLAAGNDMFVVGSLLDTTSSTIYVQGHTVSFTGGGSRRNVSIFTPGKLGFDRFIIQNGKLQIGFQSTFSGAAIVELASASSLGVFNATGNAIEVFGAGAFMGVAPFGSGSTGYGLTVSGGARALFTGTPTITGALGDFLFEGAANAIPPLVAGAAVPAASALTTWAQWAAAPFNRYVMNYTTGARMAGA